MAGGGMSVAYFIPPHQVMAAAGGVTTSVRPGRGRNRTKTELEEKVKKPVDGGVSKKSPPLRKAPPRGRYVDEYARPVV
jgi:hypothetical protein